MQVISNAILSFQHQKWCFGRAKCALPHWRYIHLLRACCCGIETAKEKPFSFFWSLYFCKCFLSPALQCCCHRWCLGKKRNTQCCGVEQRLMLSGVNVGDVALDLLLEPPFNRREIPINLNVKKVSPRLLAIVPHLSNEKLTTGIRLNADSFWQFHIDFPLELPFRDHARQCNRRVRLGKQSCCY